MKNQHEAQHRPAHVRRRPRRRVLAAVETRTLCNLQKTPAMKTLAEFTEACNYPGRLNCAEVESALAKYCAALGITRKIVRLPTGWKLEQYPALEKYVGEVIQQFPAIAARDAIDATTARDARDAILRLHAHRWTRRSERPPCRKSRRLKLRRLQPSDFHASPESVLPLSFLYSSSFSYYFPSLYF